ncbi:MAG TPA: flagellar biosynthetic protein FliQ [Pirellulales bacterium]|nr:flagellar biosynthetic protein FliQ [Pirellulales bacterium]
MDLYDAVDVGREALSIALLISAPMLIVGLVVGLLAGVVQALTQVQDQAVSFVPKLIAVLVASSLALPWAAALLQEYAQDLFTQIPARL